MWVSSLNVDQLPGVSHPVRVDVDRPGLVLLYGANGSGKSSIGRAIQGILWGADARSRYLSATLTVHATSGVVGASLHYGHLSWQGEAPTLSPSLKPACQLSLRELLENSDSDDAMARQVQKQLDGGFDLEALRPSKHPKPRPSKTLRTAERDAQENLTDTLRAHQELASEQATLDDLSDQIQQAQDAPKRKVRLVNELKRRSVQQRLSAIEAELDALPPNLQTVPDDAVERVRGLSEDRADKERKLASLVAERDTVAATVDALAFSPPVPSVSTLTGWRQRAHDVAREMQTAQALKTDAIEAQAQAQARRNALWTEPSDSGWPTQSDVDAVNTALDAVREARDRCRALPDTPDGRDLLDVNQREGLHDARTALRRWFATERVVHVDGDTPLQVPIAVVCIVLGAVLAALGGVLALGLGGPLPWMVFGLGVGLIGVGIGLVAARVLPSTGTRDSSVAQAEAAYTGQALVPVTSWSAEGVSTALIEVERRLTADHIAGQERQRADDATREQTAAQNHLNSVIAKRDAVFARVGLDPSLGELTTRILAERWRVLGDALSEERTAKTRWQEHNRIAKTALSALVGDMGEHAAQADPNELTRLADALIDQRQNWQAASDSLADLERRITEKTEELQSSHDALSTLLSACGVDSSDSPELHARHAAVAVYRRLSTDVRALQAQLGDLPAQTRFDVMDDDALAEQIDQEEARSDTLSQLHTDKAAIEERIASATRGNAVQQALRDSEAAADALIDDRDAQLADRTQRALFDWLSENRRAEHTPPLQQRASHWFSRFTHNRYAMEVQPGAGLVARDLTTDRVHALSELSDGTRIQLLLAARLATIEKTETPGDPVPLFIDEALSTADPERSSQIAQAILELVRSGRQVFYATASPAELAQWQREIATAGEGAVTVVKLGAVDTSAEWTDVELPAALPATPMPNSDAIAYVSALGLPRPTLHDEPSSWPVALVLHDDLDSAYRAAVLGVRTVGQLSLLSMDLPRASLIAGRVRALDAGLTHLRIGRGRPVTWQAVEDSKAVSSTFEDRVRSVLEANTLDPERFVDQVGELPRFRNSSADQLREHLVDIGVLDTRPALSFDGVVRQTQHSEPGDLTPADVAQWVRFVVDVVELDMTADA